MPVTSPLLQQVLPCLRSHDWQFRIEVILIQTRLNVGTESVKF